MTTIHDAYTAQLDAPPTVWNNGPVPTDGTALATTLAASQIPQTLADQVAGTEVAQRSSNYNPYGNFNPLSAEDEWRLRLDVHDFAEQSTPTLEELAEEYRRIGDTSDVGSQSIQAGLVGLLTEGLSELKGLIPLPDRFTSKNGVIDEVTDRLFGSAKDAVFDRLDEATRLRMSRLSTNPEVAFLHVDEAIDAFDDQTSAIDSAIKEAERILQSRRAGTELSEDDRQTLADVRTTFQAYYGTDFQSGTAEVNRDALRSTYYGQHWRVTNYVAAQEKISLVEAQAFRNEAMAIGGPDLENPVLTNNADYNEFHYNRRGAEGAAASAEVWSGHYNAAITASQQTYNALDGADGAHWSTMERARVTWDAITAELDG